MLSDLVTEHLHKIAKNEGFSNYRIEMEAGSNHGDNFMGILIAVTIVENECQNGSSKPKQLHLLCKVPSANEARRQNFSTDLIFDRELYVYSEVLPHFVRFQQEKGLSEADSFLSFPKVYTCQYDEESGNFLLIMGDLRPQKYEMWPKEKTISLENQLLFLIELGKFHGVSFAMKDQRPNEFAPYTKLKDTFSPLCIHGKMKSYVNKTIDKTANALSNPEHKKYAQNFRKNYEKIMDEILLGETSKEFGIVAHGDCWNNNVLFQYADNEKEQVKAVSFLDWQITRYCPAVLDFVYNVFQATDREFRKQHYETLLNTYYSSLSETIRKLGSDPDKMYSFQNFQDQLRKTGDFVLLCAPMLIQIRLAGAKDVNNLDEYAERVARGEDADLLNNFDEETQSAFEELVNGVVNDLFDYGYLQSA